MNTFLYTVQQGDTLSHLAQRLGSSVDELRSLNAFINNPNYIRTGWTLTLPESGSPSRADNADVTPETGTSDVLHLDPIAAPPERCTIDFCGEQACKRSTHYADLIYEIGQDRFWLLREHTLNTLIAAADDLQKSLLTSDPDARVKALNAAGLLEPFLEPKASSFLDARDSQRYLEIEYELSKIRDEIERIQADAKAQHGRNVDDSANLSFEQLRLIGEQQRSYHPLRRELSTLDAKGRKIALERGYSFEGGQLFSAEALKARDIIQRYLKQRQVLVELGSPHFTRQEIDEFHKDYAELKADLKRSHDRNAPIRLDAEQWLLHSKKKYYYSEFTKTLLEAAAYGLALPEFALQGGDEDIHHGIAEYDEYHTHLRNKAALEQRVETSFENWIHVTKQSPPSSLFKQEEALWHALEAQGQTLKKHAEDFVKRQKPIRHLLWNPENFAPQPQQRLVRNDFPLREISVPTELTRLRHLSLADVFKDLNQRTRDILKADLNKVLANAKNPAFKIAEGNTVADPDLFSTWLKMHDARPLDIQDGWFDRNGFFLPDAFKRYIKNEHLYIENLRDDATFDAWGEDLRQMLYKKSLLGPLRLFDNSPQARLIRCLTPPQSNLQVGTQIQAPGMSLGKGISASAKLTLDINLARGEVDVATFEIPERSAAKELSLKYRDHQDGYSVVNAGSFCLAGSIKAWGFAGASMMLSTHLRLGPNKRENDDLGLDTSRDAERRITRMDTGINKHIRLDDALGAQLNLFAGVQAGVKISGSLLWKPPADLITLQQPFFKKHVDNEGWLELAVLGLNATAALGVGGKLGFNLSLQNGQVILRMSAAVIAGAGIDGAFNFVVGYKAITQILDLFNKALVKNNYKKLDWVEPDAFAYFSKLQMLGAVGVNIQWVFLMGYNVADKLYEAMKAGERAGPIAYVIFLRKEETEFQQWYSGLTPEGLGSLLNTLLQTPRAFEVEVQEGTSEKRKVYYNAQDAHLLQQQAIETVLTAIYYNSAFKQQGDDKAYEDLTSAQQRFGKAVLRFDSFSKPPHELSVYHDNIFRMDSFMVATAGKRQGDREMQQRYLAARNKLGEAMDQRYCLSVEQQKRNLGFAKERDPWKNC